MGRVNGDRILTVGLFDEMIELHTDHAAVIRLLEEFASPHMTVSPVQAHAVRRVHALFHSQPPKAPDGPWEPVRLFFGASGRAWRSGGVTHIESADAVTYRISSAEISVWYPSSHPFWLLDPVRLAREIMASSKQGWIRLHAAAAVGGTGAVVICGASGAGKSTVLAELLRRGLSFLANDRLLVDPGGQVHGLPLAVRWSARQLDLFPRGREFRRHAATRSFLRRQDNRSGFTKYELTPAELAQVTNQPLVCAAPLGAAVLLAVPMSEKRETFGDHVLDPDPAFPAFFMTQRPTPPHGSVEAWEAMAAKCGMHIMTATPADRIADTLVALLNHNS